MDKWIHDNRAQCAIEIWNWTLTWLSWWQPISYAKNGTITNNKKKIKQKNLANTSTENRSQKRGVHFYMDNISKLCFVYMWCPMYIAHFGNRDTYSKHNNWKILVKVKQEHEKMKIKMSLNSIHFCFVILLARWIVAVQTENENKTKKIYTQFGNNNNAIWGNLFLFNEMNICRDFSGKFPSCYINILKMSTRNRASTQL